MPNVWLDLAPQDLHAGNSLQGQWLVPQRQRFIRLAQIRFILRRLQVRQQVQFRLQIIVGQIFKFIRLEVRLFRQLFGRQDSHSRRLHA